MNFNHVETVMLKNHVEHTIIVPKGIDTFAPSKNGSWINNQTVIMKWKTFVSEKNDE
jgi:hypothetical protein